MKIEELDILSTETTDDHLWLLQLLSYHNYISAWICYMRKKGEKRELECIDNSYNTIATIPVEQIDWVAEIEPDIGITRFVWKREE